MARGFVVSFCINSYLLSAYLRMTSSVDMSGSQEFCENETFSARCEESEAIIITEARYGRMKANRCVQNQLGCERNIVPYMDMACSGRQSCTVAVRDLLVSPYVGSPCDSNLRNYLRASYTCVPVTSPAVQRCFSAPIQVSTNSSGFLASYITRKTGCGTDNAPWIIKALPGQKISFTLYDFGPTIDDTNSCKVLAVINDPSRPPKTVCSKTERIQQVHLSGSNLVHVRLMGYGGADENVDFLTRHYLFKFEAVGCPDPTSLDDETIFRRIPQGGELECKHQKHVWQVTCQGNTWRGNLVNCSEYIPIIVKPATSDNALPIPSTLSIIIVLAIAVLIGLGILIVGLLYLRRRRGPRNSSNAQPVADPDPRLKLADVEQYHSAIPAGGHYATSQPPLPHGGDTLYDSSGMRGNAYYRTWELQRHNMPPHGSTADVGAHGQPPMDRSQRLFRHSSACTDISETPSEKYNDLEHIYESPKSVRKEMPATKDGLQYYELDPNNPENQDPPPCQPRFGNSYST